MPDGGCRRGRSEVPAPAWGESRCGRGDGRGWASAAPPPQVPAQMWAGGRRGAVRRRRVRAGGAGGVDRAASARCPPLLLKHVPLFLEHIPLFHEHVPLFVKHVPLFLKHAPLHVACCCLPRGVLLPACCMMVVAYRAFHAARNVACCVLRVASRTFVCAAAVQARRAVGEPPLLAHGRSRRRGSNRRRNRRASAPALCRHLRRRSRTSAPAL